MTKLKRKPRVLFLNSCVHGGGAGNSLSVYLEQASQDIEAHIVVPELKRLGDQIGDRAKFWIMPDFVERIHRCPYDFMKDVRSPTLHMIANWWALPQSMSKISQLCREIKPDLIYCNHMLTEPVGLEVSRRTGVPLIIHARNIHVTWFGHRYYRYTARQNCVKAVISNSAATAFLYQDVCPDKVRIIYNFLDCQKFRATAPEPRLRRHYGIPEDAFVVGYMGRLVGWKGVELLLRAFQMVYHHHPETYLCILGEDDSGNHRSSDLGCQQLARNLGIDPHTVFVGFRRDIRPYLADFNVLALPSTQPEPFGRVLIEAMSLGIPCVNAAHGGAIEVVEHGKTGLWFEPRSALDLTRQLFTLIQNPGLGRELGQKGQQRALERFDAKLNSAAITDIIEAVASGEKLPSQMQPVEQPMVAVS